jgi:hypothetical protein
MKRLVGILLVMAFAVFAIVDTIHDLIVNDVIHYFSEQPHRLFLVAAIGITGGLIAFGFAALSPRLQHRAKLITLGSGASFVTLAGGYASFKFASLISNLPPPVDSAIPRHMPLILLFGTIAIAGLLWFEFYQILRSHRDRMA